MDACNVGSYGEWLQKQSNIISGRMRSNLNGLQIDSDQSGWGYKLIAIGMGGAAI